MDLEAAQKRIESSVEQISAAIFIAREIGAPEEKLLILEDTEFFLRRLSRHLDSLREGRGLSFLESELKETDRTLQGLKETLRLWDEPNQALIDEVSEAQTEIRKNLRLVRSGRQVKSGGPKIVLGVGLALIAAKSINRPSR